MNRRSFLAAAASLPLIGYVKAKPVRLIESWGDRILMLPLKHGGLRIFRSYAGGNLDRMGGIYLDTASHS